MKTLIIGTGEIGSALAEYLSDYHEVFQRDIEQIEIDEDIDVLNICYPYSDKFVEITKEYINEYSPTITIVHSTTDIGTCRKIGKNVIHSPIEGKHPNLETSMKEWRRWLGCKDKLSLALAEKFFREADMRVISLADSRFTEYLKLRSTTKYLWNIAWAEMEGEWSEKLGMPYNYNQKYDIDYNILYSKLGLPQFKRYILDPPESKEIGGHCLIPNRDMLSKSMPHKYLKILEDYEQKED